MQKRLKTLRVWVSLIFFLMTIFLFTGVVDHTYMLLFKGSLFFQFLPSLISFLTVFTVGTAGFLVVLVLTLLFGRIYCSTICPLGTYQDILIRISRSLVNRNSRYQDNSASQVIHFIITGAVFISLMGGSLLLVHNLDPFTLSGNFISLISEFPEIEKSHVYLSGIVLLMFVLVSLTSLYRGRWFCNIICPVGGALRILTNASLFRINISETVCSGCGDCVAVCKTDCIEPKTRKIDFEKCVCCFNCLKVCEHDAVGFRSRIKSHRVQRKTDKSDRGRRRFLKTMISGAGTIVLAAPILSSKEWIHDKSPVTPPGSRDFYHFSKHCTACHLCIQQCPTRVLQPGFLDYGINGLFQPKMDFSTGYCLTDCTICGTICPTSAIFALSPEEKPTIQIGRAVYIKNQCNIVINEKSCSVCANICPAGAITLAPWLGDLQIPQVNEQYCTGCGACEYSCPARPERGIFIESNRYHRVAMIQKRQ